MEAVTEAPHLFIAGAPRCGTTALFDQLASHPDIAPCRLKEPNFLIPEELPMRGLRHLPYERGLEAYRALFDDHSSGIRMEASASYIYAPGVPERIREHFPNGRVVFVLRDPIARIVSEYWMVRTMQVIPHRMDFEDYLALQREHDDGEPSSEPELRALRNGLYSRFIADYIATLGRERVHVVWSEALHAAPEAAVADVCAHIGIDARRLRSQPTRRSNPSRDVRRPRVHGTALRLEALRYRFLLQGGRARRLSARALRRSVTAPLFEVSTEPAEALSVRDRDRRFLRSYYREETERLEALLGEPPPWDLEGSADALRLHSVG